ncbi:GntR family transcriptional regulator [Sporosarcina sp. SAFN-015]|uniref:GntR family transcriptional regulator n=1 Tax=Sporosarcina sp. SAFN-015 TaxID=3387274 RepID=UPI003F7F2AD0
MKKSSMESMVYFRLRSAILNRKLAPGTQLVEQVISKGLKVSRTPVRNAIKLLSEEGMVDMIPNRGAFVANPTKGEVVQAYELRLELELLAIRASLYKLDEDDFEEMTNCIQEESSALRAKDMDNYLKANKRFHMVAVKKAGNAFLEEFMETLLNKTDIYLMLFDCFFDDFPSTPRGPEEHLAIVEAMKSKKMKEIERLIQLHVEHALESLADQVREYKMPNELFIEL